MGEKNGPFCCGSSQKAANDAIKRPLYDRRFRPFLRPSVDSRADVRRGQGAEPVQWLWMGVDVAGNRDAGGAGGPAKKGEPWGAHFGGAKGGGRGKSGDRGETGGGGGLRVQR